eukprot:TRINITY_DN1475_c0_g1_i1.p1 TRINITY_DN1475_c0_g1~~TRINITY_DN1475_c0_g1_i1.p1  ORF type:complete len:374 (+),score=90.90 TRINITY_DN1475_c0_g1_i1:155-1276(+)
MTKFQRYLKKMDLTVSPKISEGLIKKSTVGGIVTLISILVCIFMIGSEMIDYLHIEEKHSIIVDSQIGGELPIHFNITFPRLPCHEITLDALDIAGNAKINVLNNVWKTGLDSNLKPLTQKVSVIEQELTDESCGSCGGAQETKDQCCNTCDDVIAAYNKKQWAIKSLSQFSQCIKEGRAEAINADSVGCEIQGSIGVERVKGTFHITPGPSHQYKAQHYHPFTEETLKYDTSYVINELRFGDPVGFLGPLNGFTEEFKENKAQMIQYFLNVVPTTYNPLKGKAINTYQYTATSQKTTANVDNKRAMPGLYFMYDLQPMRVVVTQTRSSLGHLLVSVVAVVGGIISVLTLLDNIYFVSQRAIRRNKERLGKLR